jgi:hypothetical protein
MAEEFATASRDLLCPVRRLKTIFPGGRNQSARVNQLGNKSGEITEPGLIGNTSTNCSEYFNGGIALISLKAPGWG